jgi:hypothetical protein
LTNQEYGDKDGKKVNLNIKKSYNKLKLLAKIIKLVKIAKG